MEQHYYQSPIGWIKIEAEEDAIVYLGFCDSPPKASQIKNKVIQQCCRELDEYFAKKRKFFDVKLKIKGTPFQEKVWQELLKIPYGKTISYAQLAQACGNPKAYRAAGSANGKNCIALIIPCHRVIASDGKLGGYAYGLEVKKKLLELEKAI